LIAAAILGQLQAQGGDLPPNKLPGIGAEGIQALAAALEAFRGPDATEEQAQARRRTAG
jgi:hypothetical protein